MQLTEDQVNTLKDRLGVEDVQDPAALVTLLSNAIDELRSDNVTFLDRMESAEAKVVELSREDKPENEIDQGLLKDRVELARLRIERRVDKGDIPAWLGTKLTELYADDKAPDVVMLSRGANDESPLDKLLDLFTGAKLGNVKPEATGIQNLARVVPDNNGNNGAEPDIVRVQRETIEAMRKNRS